MAKTSYLPGAGYYCVNKGTLQATSLSPLLIYQHYTLSTKRGCLI
jgi:hypothetical protein